MQRHVFLLKMFSLAIILGLTTFGLHKIVTSVFHYFNEPLSYSDPERLGQFGDFLGETLNPIAAICISYFVYPHHLRVCY